MQVERTFNEIISDNEDNFISMLVGVIEAVDELCHLQIDKRPNMYHFRVAPSIPVYSEMLLQEILKFHNVFGIHLELSKSIKTSGGSIDFEISLN